MQVFYTINTNPFHVLVNMNNNQIAKLILKREFRAYLCGLITGLTTYGLLVNPHVKYISNLSLEPLLENNGHLNNQIKNVYKH